jgi:Protein of unknown function (DUF1638)
MISLVLAITCKRSFFGIEWPISCSTSIQSSAVSTMLGTYFLTDFLVRSFDHLVVKGLGLDRFPQLRDDFFGNYRRVVCLAQRDDPALVDRARRAADLLGLPLEVQPVGYGALETRLLELMRP